MKRYISVGTGIAGGASREIKQLAESQGLAFTFERYATLSVPFQTFGIEGDDDAIATFFAEYRRRHPDMEGDWRHS